MKVQYDEGLANRIDPEPCVGVREDAGEASAGERTGQPSSRERLLVPGRRRFCPYGRQHGGARKRERFFGPARSENLACA